MVQRRLRPLAAGASLALLSACGSDPNLPRSPSAAEGGEAGAEQSPAGGGDAGAGGDTSGGAPHSGGQAGADAGGRAGAAGQGGEVTACCGCLCADPTWSCSADTCLDDQGRALGLDAEAGFFELEGEGYVSEGDADRNSPRHRIWYAFQPADEAPENKPLAVLFNGGPGSATTVLFAFNTGRITLDPDLTLGRDIAENPSSWTALWNLLYIDAPSTGFSYALPMHSGLRPTVGIDLDRDAASFLRVIVRFLKRHPALRDNALILVGESYGGTRATLMLEHLFRYRRLISEDAAYRDPPLYAELVEHFSSVLPALDPTALGPDEISTQFGAQVLIQPVVAGSTQWNLNTPDTSACLENFDANQCDEPLGWFDEQIATVADRMTTLDTLRRALGVDPTTIRWLYASERAGAYGRSNGTTADPTEMAAVFGALGAEDAYYLTDNREVREGYDLDSRWWDDPLLGASFLENAFYVRTFMSNARLDVFVWAPAIPAALAAYTGVLGSSLHDGAPRSGFDRPGWILLDYRADAYPSPAAREIRFPLYASAGHGVSLRAHAELLSDLSAWHRQ